MARVICYYRVGTEAQAQSGRGPSEQRDALRDMVNDAEWFGAKLRLVAVDQVEGDRSDDDDKPRSSKS